MIDRKSKSYAIECPDCKEVRYVTYTQNWNIETGKCSKYCMSCAGKRNENKGRFPKGSVPHNKGLLGWKKGHPAYYNAFNDKNHFFGKTHTKETKEKMRLAKFGKLGELASNWRGGLVPLTSKIRHSDNYNKWRSDVFERDNWTCQTCFIKGGTLEAHHIKLFSDVIKDNKIKTLEDALACNELWDLRNGVTLCKNCHDLIGHRWTNAFNI